MTALNIIGCGAVGRTVGRLFHTAGTFRVGDILTRSLATARAGAAFIGAGRCVGSFQELGRAEVHVIAVSDDAVSSCARALAAAGVVRPGDVVCHLSGALPSSVLEPVRALGALTASVHPVKSFADPEAAVRDFTGTWCGIEGDGGAVHLLGDAFAAIGGKPFPLDPAFKTVYHAGSVLVCNHLTSLLEAGVRAYEKGGVPRETALKVMEPLVRGTVDNVFRFGTVEALTGPIARGDAAVVSAQLAALEGWDSGIAAIYRSLSLSALQLSRQRGRAPEEALDVIGRIIAHAAVEDAASGCTLERERRDEELRRQAEEALLVNQEQLKSLAIELSLVEERERRRIAAELHDEIGQNLAMIKMKIGSLQEPAPPELKEADGLLDKTIQEVRSLTFQISPPLLYEVGFDAAVEWLAEQFEEKHRLRVEVRGDAAPLQLDEELGSTLYHVVRELLVNVVKHAEAKTVAVLFGRSGNAVEVTVRDDGRGMPQVGDGAERRTLHGFGLFNIRQRVQHLGGEIRIDAAPGGGTRIFLRVPLTAPSAGKGAS